MLLSLQRKAAGARASHVLTQSFPAQPAVQGISRGAGQCMVRNSFCLVKPQSPVDLATVLPAHKGLPRFQACLLGRAADYLLLLQPVVA